MNIYWIIEKKDSAGRSLYLENVWPMSFSYEIYDARHFNDSQAKNMSCELIDRGISHSVMQFSCNL